MIPDMDAVKPADWLDNEEPEIEDEEAVIPEDWDVDEDGDWEAPMVPNPACQDVSGCGEWERPEKANPDYKGKWYPPMIDNPAYKGEWKAKQIPNPKFFEDSAPLKSIGNIGAVGVEIWTMSGGLVFDNILIDKTFEDIKAFSADTFEAKAEAVKKAVEAKAEKRAAEDEKRRARESSPPIGMDLYENLANKLPVGRDQALAVLSKLTVNPVIYYLLHIVSLFAVIVGLIMRFKGEGKAAKAQQQKDAKKKKNDDASDDDPSLFDNAATSFFACAQSTSAASARRTALSRAAFISCTFARSSSFSFVSTDSSERYRSNFRACSATSSANRALRD